MTKSDLEQVRDGFKHGAISEADKKAQLSREFERLASYQKLKKKEVNSARIRISCDESL